MYININNQGSFNNAKPHLYLQYKIALDSGKRTEVAHLDLL